MRASPGADSAPASEPLIVGLTAASFERRARDRLNFDLPAGLFEEAGPTPGGDHVLDPASPRHPGLPRAAAVLVPVVARPDEATVLLTTRAGHLRAHSGQIAWPGGKIDPTDASPADAALREAEEEVGLARRFVTPLGYLDPYLTGTGYLIVPTVALVTPGFELVVNPQEVDDAFEVPLAFLMETANHRITRRELGGRSRTFYIMSYLERHIWGATAGIVRSLYERLYV